MALEKVIKLKHGISENGELQVFEITKILEDGKLIDTITANPYSPTDIKNMDGFDQRSKDIVEAINTKEVKDSFEVEKQVKTGVGIEKIISHDRTIEESGAIAVRQVIRIFDNGKEISKKYHRSWINPGDNPEGKDAMSKAVAKKIHTEDVVKKHKEKKNAEVI